MIQSAGLLTSAIPFWTGYFPRLMETRPLELAELLREPGVNRDRMRPIALASPALEVAL